VDVNIKGGQVKEVLDKMADVICTWNANHVYSRTEHNCQQFIDALCQGIGIQLNFKGSLAEYLNHLRQHGTCELKYTLTSYLQKLLNTTDQYRVFHNHKDLDELVKNILDKDPVYFDITAKDDWALLKSFDRAFWLRYFKNKLDDNWKAHFVMDHALLTSCPFGHPEKSLSIVEDYMHVQTYKSAM
jgi:hypothetical protein